MNWEEAVILIRSKPEFKQLVEDAYFDSDLVGNISRYGNSDEFHEILELLAINGDLKLIDVGSGNGISAINFALKGFKVVAVEPDESDTVGSKAIQSLKEHFGLKNLSIKSKFGEDTGLGENNFDIFFARQTMHHANDLNQFVREAYRILKPNGVFLTVRDHVIYDDADKQWFLETHPLHHLYGGENAFTSEQYLDAIQNAGFIIKQAFKHFESPINYHPIKSNELMDLPQKRELELRNHLHSKIGKLSSSNLVFNFYKSYAGFSKDKILDEKFVPGRMYSFLALKP